MRGVMAVMSSLGQGVSRMSVCVHFPRRDSKAARTMEVVCFPLRLTLSSLVRRRFNVMRNFRNSWAGVVEWNVRFWMAEAGVYFVSNVLSGRRVD